MFVRMGIMRLVVRIASAGCARKVAVLRMSVRMPRSVNMGGMFGVRMLMVRL
jgi:hypothetical protein